MQDMQPISETFPQQSLSCCSREIKLREPLSMAKCICESGYRTAGALDLAFVSALRRAVLRASNPKAHWFHRVTRRLLGTRIHVSKDLDEIDLKILSEIQADGRITNVELAKRAGISPP